METGKKVNPAPLVGVGAALLVGIGLKKRHKAKKAAKEAVVIEAVEKKKKKKAAEAEEVEAASAAPAEATPSPEVSDHLLRDVALITAKYRLKSKKKRTKPLALLILLYLVEQIYREWERQDGGLVVEEPAAKAGKKGRKGKK